MADSTDDIFLDLLDDSVVVDCSITPPTPSPVHQSSREALIKLQQDETLEVALRATSFTDIAWVVKAAVRVVLHPDRDVYGPPIYDAAELEAALIKAGFLERDERDGVLREKRG